MLPDWLQVLVPFAVIVLCVGWTGALGAVIRPRADGLVDDFEGQNKRPAMASGYRCYLLLC